MLGLNAPRRQHVAALRLRYVRYHLRVPETELLYATDAYMRAFDARVQQITPEGGVVLDRTCFYPTGGGQPHDLGSLTWNAGSANVVEVKKDGGQVVHKIDGATPPPGTQVHGQIDWDRHVIRVETTIHTAAKSHASEDEIDVDPQLTAMLRKYYPTNTSEFVINSPVAPRPEGVTQPEQRLLL